MVPVEAAPQVNDQHEPSPEPQGDSIPAPHGEARPAAQDDAPARPKAGLLARSGFGRGSIVVGAVAILVAAGSGIALALRGAAGSSSLPLNSPLARLMALSDGSMRPAPGFSLVDQHGRRMSLQAFRNKTVVLEFMDPHCTDICPIVSAEFKKAEQDLGAARNHVVFVAVNVNRYANSVASVAQFSREQGLNTLPNWYFFTGSPSQLSRVWAEYGIYVQSRGPKADVIHSSYIFFIDPAGRERFVATPTDDHTAAGTAYLPLPTQLKWGEGIASYAKGLLSS